MRNVSLTFSPLHLLLPVFEASAELKIANHLSISVIGGFGSVSLDSTDPTLGDLRADVWEIGTQIVGYPIEDFDSLQLGVELMYLHVSLDDVESGSGRVSASGAGLAVGPLIGYKLLTRAGFTFAVQGGVAFLAVKAQAKNDVGEQEDADDSTTIPLLNANLGWSF